MKKLTKLLAAASLTAGGALGVLFAPDKGSETRKKLKRKIDKLQSSFEGEYGKEKLLMVRDKLEKRKERLEKYLQKIDAVIDEYDIKKDQAGKMSV